MMNFRNLYVDDLRKFKSQSLVSISSPLLLNHKKSGSEFNLVLVEEDYFAGHFKDKRLLIFNYDKIKDFTFSHSQPSVHVTINIQNGRALVFDSAGELMDLDLTSFFFRADLPLILNKLYC